MNLYTLRTTTKKWLYGRCPGLAGAFSYYGTKVYFPKKSKIFELACQQGIYEYDNIKLILSLIKPNSIYIDVGANIGLMAIPILNQHPTCKVISWEPSPNALPFLIRTVEGSKFQDRWHVIGKAAGDSVGELEFSIASAELGAFDGFQDTQRAGYTKKVTVPTTTLDMEWEARGCPSVSIIKIDVEGAELKTLQGAINCLKKDKPYILLEWNSTNLKAYNNDTESLLNFSQQIKYQVFTTPNLIPVSNVTTLELHMLKSETFLLVPES